MNYGPVLVIHVGNAHVPLIFTATFLGDLGQSSDSITYQDLVMESQTCWSAFRRSQMQATVRQTQVSGLPHSWWHHADDNFQLRPNRAMLFERRLGNLLFLS